MPGTGAAPWTSSTALWVKVIDREGASEWTMLEKEQTVQPISEIRSSHQSHVYEVCAWYGLWDTHIYVAMVAVSVEVCVYKLSALPHFLAACTHSSDLLCDSVISSGREKMRALQMVRHFEGCGAPSRCQKNL